MRTFEPTAPVTLMAVGWEDPFGETAAGCHPDHEPRRGLLARFREGLSLLYGSISLCCFVSGLVALALGVSAPLALGGKLLKVRKPR